jgi:hypothetical protein
MSSGSGRGRDVGMFCIINGVFMDCNVHCRTKKKCIFSFEFVVTLCV